MASNNNINLGKNLSYYDYSYLRAFLMVDIMGALNPKLITQVALHENGVSLTQRDGVVHNHLYSDLALEIVERNLGGGLVGLGANMMASARDKVNYYQLKAKNGGQIMNITSCYSEWHDLGETLLSKIYSKYAGRLGKL